MPVSMLWVGFEIKCCLGNACWFLYVFGFLSFHSFSQPLLNKYWTIGIFRVVDYTFCYIVYWKNTKNWKHQIINEGYSIKKCDGGEGFYFL
jgi:hypothetical protein